jgi:hypothetical protein
MATNLKGKGRFVSLLLLHGEKIAIGLVGLVAILIVYKSLKVEKLGDDHQADKLQSEISRTSSEVKEFTWDKAVTEHPDKVKKRQPITVEGEMNVPVKDYVPSDSNGNPILAIDNPIVAPLILRRDPLILNVVDVKATGGSGLFAFVDEKIRQQQALKLAEQAKEAERKAIEQQKREAQKAKEGAGPGGGRRGRGEGPGEVATEPIDPAHPKRRLVQGSFRPTGNMLQGGERIERAYWACVVAKVPIREQLKLYQDALEKARGADPTRDFPSYVGFYAERAEVVPGKELVWTPVPLYDAQRQSITENKPLTSPPSHAVHKDVFMKVLAAAAQFWAGGISMDVVDARYAEFPLTLPLPPLVGREWGAEVTHPDIPWGPYTPALEPETTQLPPEAAAQQPGGATSTSEFGSAAPTQGQGPGASPGYGPPGRQGEFAGPGGGFGRRMMGPEGGPGMMPGMGPGAGRFGPGGGEGPGGFRGGGGSGQAAGQHTSLPKGVDYYLLRFFDFSVEPGKKYKYHVKLVMHDANYNMPQAVLDATVLDRQAKEWQAAKAKGGPNATKPFYRVVEKWSDPSPAVGIPMAGNVRLAETKVTEKVNDEPIVKLIVEAFDVDDSGTPIQGAAKKDFRRGYVANMIGDAFYQPDPTMMDIQPNFKFFTGMTLLDVDGGGKLARDMTYPARILVMGPAGELYIRNDSDDKPYVDSFRMIFEDTLDPRRNQLGPEGPGGAPGRQGPGRGR